MDISTDLTLGSSSSKKSAEIPDLNKVPEPGVADIEIVAEAAVEYLTSTIQKECEDLYWDLKKVVNSEFDNLLQIKFAVGSALKCKSPAEVEGILEASIAAVGAAYSKLRDTLICRDSKLSLRNPNLDQLSAFFRDVEHKAGSIAMEAGKIEALLQDVSRYKTVLSDGARQTIDLYFQGKTNHITHSTQFCTVYDMVAAPPSSDCSRVEEIVNLYFSMFVGGLRVINGRAFFSRFERETWVQGLAEFLMANRTKGAIHVPFRFLEGAFKIRKEYEPHLFVE